MVKPATCRSLPRLTEGRAWCVRGALRDSALEFIAAARSDGILVLDETGMCDPRVIGETVHMLAVLADVSKGLGTC